MFSLLMQLPNQVSSEGKFNQGEKRANIASTPSWLFPVMRYLRDENRWSFHLLCKESASFPICFYRWPFACCVCAVVSSHWLLRFPSRGRRGIRGETSRPDHTKYAQTKRFVLVIYCTYYVSFWRSNFFYQCILPKNELLVNTIYIWKRYSNRLNRIITYEPWHADLNFSQRRSSTFFVCDAYLLHLVLIYSYSILVPQVMPSMFTINDHVSSLVGIIILF